MTPAVLVAGVGNVLLGDDGFGVEVVRRLGATALPSSERVRVADFGIRALHLAYVLCEPFDLVILVDAMSRGADPGTLFVLAADIDELGDGVLPDAHELHPATVLRVARELGASLGCVHVVGCEPANLEEGIGLSPAVDRAADEAVRVVHQLLRAVPGRQGEGDEGS
jgi:hydrogenase maturation protease